MPDDPRTAPSPPSKLSEVSSGSLYTSALDGQQAFARWLQGMFSVAQEITQFTQARLQEDIAVWSTLAACSTPEQALDCQRRFAARATEQYVEEIMKLSRIMTTIAGEGVSSLQTAAAHRRHKAELTGK